MASDIVSYRKDSNDMESSVDSKRDCCVKRSETYYHTKQSEVSNVESKQDFSPMAQNDKILETFNTKPCIWVQLGLHNTEAAKIAKQHGMLYEEDSCIKLEYMRIFSK